MISRINPFRASSYIWLAVPVVSYVGILFPMNVAATASQHCIDALRGHGARLANVSDVSWMRTDGSERAVAVVYERNGAPVTAKCSFKEDTHVVEDIQIKQSNAMAEFVAMTRNTWFPL